MAILNDDAKHVIKQQDGLNTLIYLDPPYCPDARTAIDVYAHEMSLDDHGDMLDVLMSSSIKSKILLSGYDNDLYRHRLRNWDKISFDLPNHSASGATKRRMTEVVWANYDLGHNLTNLTRHQASIQSVGASHLAEAPACLA